MIINPLKIHNSLLFALDPGLYKAQITSPSQKRNRSPKEGLDGSPHRWFGNKPSTLILGSDDAIGKPLYGIFQKQENLHGCFQDRLVSELRLKGIDNEKEATEFLETSYANVSQEQ